MSREWKPGDVALVTTGVKEGRLGYVAATVGESDAIPIAFPDGEEEGGIAVLAYGLGSLRPVVVIDPESREQCQRLASAMTEHRAPGPNVYNVQAAVRSLVAPPKPPEPTGLGAVVEDESGTLWVRRGAVHWVSPDPHHYNDARTWGEIDAAEVLSEGMQP